MGGDVLTVGLIGHPIGHSRSPVMQQAAFDALGIPARYVLWDTPPEELPARVAALRQPGMLGANVTIPYKSAVRQYLDGPDDAGGSPTGGAINTITREETESGVRLVGHNTDVAGLRRALAEAGAWQAGRRLLILGAGGAARAALAVAALEGASACVAARDVAHARAAALAVAGARGTTIARMSEALALSDAEALASALRETDVLINATPVGTNDVMAMPLKDELLRQLPGGAFVFDMVYSPPETALVRAARAAGLRASGGLPMLLYQGAESFRLWTGRVPPLGQMRAALGLHE